MFSKLFNSFRNTNIFAFNAKKFMLAGLLTTLTLR